MRDFVVAKIQCARCGAPLEIKFPGEVSDEARNRPSYFEDGITGAVKFDMSIFVEPCAHCQTELEGPARMILEGIKKLQEAQK